MSLALVLDGSVELLELAGMLEKTESALNILGYVPFVGSVSGGVRGILATVELVAGVAITVLAGLSFFFGNAAALPIAVIGIKFALHGILNGIRGSFEGYPGVSLVTCLPYDIISWACLGGRVFSYIVI